MKTVSAVPLVDRLINAVHANLVYLGKLVAPLNLSVIYPHWSSTEGLDGPSGLQTAIELAILGLISAAAIRAWRRHDWRMPAVMWGLWLVLLLPVIGILQVGDQSMADRYTYLPSIGIFTIFVAALLWPVDHDPRSAPAAVAIAVLLLIGCSIGTWQRAQVWENSETLFAAAIAAEPMSATAHMNLGQALSKRGATERAVHHYAIAARLKPGNPSAHFNLGNSLRDSGQLEKAIAEYEIALRAQPDYAPAANNLGDVYARLQRFDEAIQWFEQAVEFDPALAAAHINLARACLIVGRDDDALVAARRALDLDPSNERYRETLTQARKKAQ